jgi:hypothetical protein
MWHVVPEQLLVSMAIDGSPPVLAGSVIGEANVGAPAA